MQLTLDLMSNRYASALSIILRTSRAAKRRVRAMSSVRKGQAPPKLSRDAFQARFRSFFQDPAYDSAPEALARIEEIAWDAYANSRKAPRTQKAGPEFADPDYDLSVEWLATRARLQQAEQRQKDPSTRARVLVV